MAGPTDSTSKLSASKAKDSKKGSAIKSKKGKEHQDEKVHSTKRNVSKSHSKSRKTGRSDSKKDQKGAASGSKYSKNKIVAEGKNQVQNASSHVTVVSDSKPKTRSNSKKSAQGAERSISKGGIKSQASKPKGSRSPTRGNSSSKKRASSKTSNKSRIQS
jgi:hypothetical protein